MGRVRSHRNHVGARGPNYLGSRLKARPWADPRPVVPWRDAWQIRWQRMLDDMHDTEVPREKIHIRDGRLGRDR